MSRAPGLKSPETVDWDAIYRDGTPAWEIGRPAKELLRVLDSGLFDPRTVLELGCGTGSDAIHMAQRRFDVTAVDSSAMALERAHSRAEDINVPVRFVLDDVFDFIQTAEPFDFIYDAGFYHFMRRENLDGLLDLLWRMTTPGSYYLALAGSTDEIAEGGPPQVTETQIRSELGRLFEFVHIRPFRFESRLREEGYAGWSCLMRRPMPVR